MRFFSRSNNRVVPSNPGISNNNGQAGAVSSQINTDDANNLSLIEATSKRDIANVERLLRDSKERVKIDSTNELGSTALMVACYSNYPEIVEKLIEAGAIVNLATEEEGTTALMEVSQNGNNEIAKKLIGAKADVNMANKVGGTALHTACQFGHPGIVEQLIEADVALDLRAKNGITALHIASYYGRSKIVIEKLIVAGANVDLAKNDGATALYIACQMNNIECVEVLLKAGADPKCLMEDNGKKINSKLEGVSEKMKELIETIIIKERDKALAAATELCLSPRAPRAEVVEAQQTQGAQGR